MVIVTGGKADVDALPQDGFDDDTLVEGLSEDAVLTEGEFTEEADFVVAALSNTETGMFLQIKKRQKINIENVNQSSTFQSVD